MEAEMRRINAAIEKAEVERELFVTIARRDLRAVLDRLSEQYAPVFTRLSHAARKLGLSRKYLRQLADGGRISCMRVGRVLMFQLSAVISELEAIAHENVKQAADAAKKRAS